MASFRGDYSIAKLRMHFAGLCEKGWRGYYAFRLSYICKILFLAMGIAQRSRLTFNSSDTEGDDHGVATVQQKPQLKKPSMFKVIMLNDDYTPMDFVVEVLRTFFSMNEEKATQVMLAVHTQGSAVCGIFTRDVAETKVAQVNQYSADCQHPLLCEMEKVD